MKTTAKTTAKCYAINLIDSNEKSDSLIDSSVIHECNIGQPGNHGTILITCDNKKMGSERVRKDIFL